MTGPPEAHSKRNTASFRKINGMRIWGAREEFTDSDGLPVLIMRLNRYDKFNNKLQLSNRLQT
jgi:hypothetical protein